MSGPDDGGLPDQLFWRDEILQALYWMRSEGLGDELAAAQLAGLLDASPARLAHELRRLAGEGYLADAGDGRYRLTELGVDTGKYSFRDAFAELTRSAHGVCGPGCECHRHPTAAAACRATVPA